MAGIADSFQRAGFGGIDFACERYRIRGGLRHSIHYYRHTPRGQPEKQGRELYLFEFDAVFSSEHLAYPTAFPQDWSDLLLFFEEGETKDLIVPTVGTVKAFAVDWPVDVDFKRMRDGIKCTLSFLEDEEEMTADDVASVEVGTLPTKATALIEEGLDLGFGEDFFSSITGLINDIASAGDYYEMQAELYQDKVDSLITACQRIDENVAELNDPKAHKVVQALASLGATAIAVKDSLVRKNKPIIDFPVGVTMSFLDVSMALYGSTERAGEILRVNRNPAIPDPFAIPPGFPLRAYAP